MSLLDALGRWSAMWLSPKSFTERAGVWARGFRYILLMTLVYGLVGGLFWAPADYQQGDAFRIIYLHVPCAFWSMGLYALLGICSCFVLVYQMPVAEAVARATAPVGALFTALALVTGALWGKPMWGAWWIWDARLTSELLLFFIYMGYLSLYQAIPEPRIASRVAHLFAILGLVNLPVIHYSVYWWQTLHQGSTLRLGGTSMDTQMLYPLLAMLVAFGAYSGTVVLIRAQRILVARRGY